MSTGLSMGKSHETTTVKLDWRPVSHYATCTLQLLGSRTVARKVTDPRREPIQMTYCCLCLGKPQKEKEDSIRDRGLRKGAWEHWKLKFTDIWPTALGHKNLLVIVDTFSGCVEVYPIWTETAPIVTKKLLQELIPRFGPLLALTSNNGLVIMAKCLKICWRYSILIGNYLMYIGHKAQVG